MHVGQRLISCSSTHPHQQFIKRLMAISWLESWARHFITGFLGRFISTGCLILQEEEGGETFTFQGINTCKCSLRVILRVHNPQFYWKGIRAHSMKLSSQDQGEAASDGIKVSYHISRPFQVACLLCVGEGLRAYIILTAIDKYWELWSDHGLLNLLMLLIANGDANKSSAEVKRKRWTPTFPTALISSSKLFFKHAMRQNSLTQARRNISHHYDLGNEVFALFLDETITYSCAVFKDEEEDLKVAQKRKISALIGKARIESKHEVLEIGFGWGTFAIELVKQTGCKYTGITLSQEQLNFAEMKVKEAGLQDHIRFLLCDYRELPETVKYDRIISWQVLYYLKYTCLEMIEHVGHEYMEEFFARCESVLAEEGLLVLQFISVADAEYDELRRSPGFIAEYIFPGTCIPSLGRITSAMAAASRLCVEHVENIGISYYHTLRCWRKNFLKNQSKITAMGFDEKFIRTWEYYFDYCAACFKSFKLWDYQVVFSRPGNVEALGNPYKGFPSAHNAP
ncbi:hypothetical protein Tsubulata_021576 [Turnera subulata]|uniref:Cyclopropane-fatty-acyl-phospholipid synthase n=1 Tax=Turnera subulata TaxID=218843 RepID=A0A9Q0JAG7_9ROSI|nr:hypothetical protein Tsubulata_021576 [Turnera subulata]